MKSFLPSMFYYGFPVEYSLLLLIKTETPMLRPFRAPLPSAEMWEKVEAIAPYTAQNPVPPQKVGKYAYTDDKFAIGGFTQLPSEKVRVPRIAECPIQAEAVVKQVNDRDTYALIELEFVQVHAEDHLVMEENKINPLAWEPLIYNFKHYYGLGEHKGLNFTIK